MHSNYQLVSRLLPHKAFAFFRISQSYDDPCRYGNKVKAATFELHPRLQYLRESGRLLKERDKY